MQNKLEKFYWNRTLLQIAMYNNVAPDYINECMKPKGKNMSFGERSCKYFGKCKLTLGLCSTACRGYKGKKKKEKNKTAHFGSKKLKNPVKKKRNNKVW